MMLNYGIQSKSSPNRCKRTCITGAIIRKGMITVLFAVKNGFPTCNVWARRIALLLFICFITFSMTIHVVDIVELDNDNIENGCLVSEMVIFAGILLDRIGDISFDSSALLTPQFFEVVLVSAGCLLCAVFSSPVLKKEKLSN